MPTYVAFLRAINLGSTRKFPKAAIVRACENAGFTEVETYINSGNVVFRDRLALRKDLAPRHTVVRDRANATARNVNTVRKLTALARSR